MHFSILDPIAKTLQELTLFKNRIKTLLIHPLIFKQTKHKNINNIHKITTYNIYKKKKQKVIVNQMKFKC